MPRRRVGSVERLPGSGYLDRVAAKVRETEVSEDDAAVGARVRPHPPFALRRERLELGHESALVVEELLGPVAAEPLLEEAQVVGVVARRRHRHLVRAPGSLDLLPVDLARPGPTLRRPQHEQRPPRPAPLAPLPGRLLDRGDLVERRVER